MGTLESAKERTEILRSEVRSIVANIDPEVANNLTPSFTQNTIMLNQFQPTGRCLNGANSRRPTVMSRTLSSM
jgi:uncharacterized protein YdhG (YjbR/CyaY superfamily)